MAEALKPIEIEGLSPAAAAAIVKLSKNLANSKDIKERIQFYDMATKADPSVVVPTDVALEKFKIEQATQREADALEVRKAETLRKQNEARQSLINSGRYTEDVVKKIEEEVMTPRGISDYESAAIIYAHENPDPEIKAPTRGASGATWEMPWASSGRSKEDAAKLIANPRKVALERAHAVVSELRQKRA